MPLPAAHLVHDSNGHGQLSSGPTLSEARDAYIKLKGVGKDKVFSGGVLLLNYNRGLAQYSSFVPSKFTKRTKAFLFVSIASLDMPAFTSCLCDL